MCEKLKIKSFNEKDKLAQAKEETYLKGFTTGIMLVGPHAGKKVSEAKPLIKQELIDQGRLLPDEVAEHPQRSFLTQALMGKGNVEPVLQSFPVEIGDIYLLCSDGLSGVVDDGKILSAFNGDLQSAVNSLVDLTYKNGAPDNVTMIATEIGTNPTSISPTMFGAAQ